MKILINGGCGFLGSNLASYGIQKGFQVTVLDNLSRIGSKENLKWLQSYGKFDFVNIDVADEADVFDIVANTQPDGIFHLAGQVAMTTSITNPDLDFRTNTIGSFNILEAIRRFSPNSHAIFSSTNKVYGDLQEIEIIENDTRYIAPGYCSGFGANDIHLNFQSPYGCSKGAADQYFLDYNRIYNLNTTVFRHSSMYGGRQFSTTDQGWIGWFISEAIKFQKGEISEIAIAGNGKQVRDLLYISDMVDLYYSALGNEIVYGKAFNVGGGNENSMSIIELFNFLSEKMNVEFRFKFNESRISDQKIFVSNNFELEQALNWFPKCTKEQGLENMIEWVTKTP